MDRKDFNVVANSRGYQVQYKGKNIGGAGISADAKAPTGRAAWKQTQDYLKYGDMAIQDILAGDGRKDMLEAIARIDGDIKQIQRWYEEGKIKKLSANCFTVPSEAFVMGITPRLVAEVLEDDPQLPESICEDVTIAV